VSRFIRRSWILAVLALAALPLTASLASGQVASPITITVRKVVSGPATAGSSITFSCGTGQTVTFNFDASGAPTTADAGGATVAIVDGAWQLTGSADSSPLTCAFFETATGGAASIAWTCSYSNEPIETPSAEQVGDLGCAAAGVDQGPVGLLLGSFLEVSSQTADVTFTNTYSAAPPLQPIQPAAAVVVQPTFTG
jgi:hypothetical protein